MRRLALVPLLFFGSLLFAHAGQLCAGATHYHRGTATVDGVESPLEWVGAEYGEATLVLPAGLGGGSTQVTFLVMSDDTYLYAALRFPYASSPSAPAFLDFAVQVWADGATACNATTPLDVVQLISWSNSVEFRDEHWPLCNTVISDTSAGGSSGGTGTWEDEGATLFFELSHPLDSSDDLHDVSAVSPGFVQLKPFAYGCDAAANCGQLAFLTKRVFLVPENFLFFSDFEGGDLLEWDLSLP